MAYTQTHRLLTALAAGSAVVGISSVAAGRILCYESMNRHATFLSRRAWGKSSPLSLSNAQSVEQRIVLEKSKKRMHASVDEWLSHAAYEEVHQQSTSDLSDLAATIYFADVPSRRWAILAHPYKSSHIYMRRYALMYASFGYNVLSLDMYACGDSGGTIMKMGANDALDILRWVRYLDRRFGNDIRIVLHGCSMGASAVLAASGRCAIPQVCAVVADSGFDTLPHIIEHVHNVLVPHTGHVVEKLMAHSAKHMYHMDINANSPVIYISSSHIPTLFLAGGNDRVVSSEMTKNLYTSCSAPLKSLHVFPEMGHLEAFTYDPKAYIAVVKDFLKRTESYDRDHAHTSTSFM